LILLFEYKDYFPTKALYLLSYYYKYPRYYNLINNKNNRYSV